MKILVTGATGTVGNHMFFEEPRTIFLHYWGIGPAHELAQTFKRALNTQQQSVTPALAG